MHNFEITNKISDVAQWKPYNFMQYIEQELAIRGIEYQIIDLKKDLATIKQVINYAESQGKTKVALIKYLIWIFDGITNTKITSLQLLIAGLKSYFGTKKKVPKIIKKKINYNELEFITEDLKIWLENLKLKY